MASEVKMPALSPTMEEGTLAKWLVGEGDTVSVGDILAEIETDKATMELEAADGGIVAKILVIEGTDAVKVGTVIAMLADESEAGPIGNADPSPAVTVDAVSAPSISDAPVASESDELGAGQPAIPTAAPVGDADGARRVETRSGAAAHADALAAPEHDPSERVKSSPLARRIAQQRGIELSAVRGSGSGGRVVKADLDPALARTVAPPVTAAAPSPPAPPLVPDIPHITTKLSNIRKTIARRLTESKQQVPHTDLGVDIQLDALLTFRSELNASLAARNVKISVNDFMIKALAAALINEPNCNVMFTPTELVTFERADISVAVSTPTGLITPVIVGADKKSISAISAEMRELAIRARDNKLQPSEYQGGTASLSNMGMLGITQFEAVINPPQGMIMAIGAGEARPYVVDGALGIATVMRATGSFDHRAIDGAEAAALMQRFKSLVECPIDLVA